MRDLTSQIFNRLTVIEFSHRNKYSQAVWKCQCECGNVVNIVGSVLIQGSTKSCGCLQKEMASNRAKTGLNRKHGECVGGVNPNSPYRSWAGMLSRCRDKAHPDYPRYGGRGITVTPEWEDYTTFKEWAILHGWHKGLSIDRVDINGGYNPNNCEWVTQSENVKRRWHKWSAFNVWSWMLTSGTGKSSPFVPGILVKEQKC